MVYKCGLKEEYSTIYVVENDKDNMKVDSILECIEKSIINNFYMKSEKYNIYTNKREINNIQVESFKEVACSVEDSGKEIVDIFSEYVATIELVNSMGNQYVSVGESVLREQILFRLNYVGIKLDIYSPCNGVIKDIFVSNGEFVDYSKKILSIEV